MARRRNALADTPLLTSDLEEVLKVKFGRQGGKSAPIVIHEHGSQTSLNINLDSAHITKRAMEKALKKTNNQLLPTKPTRRCGFLQKPKKSFQNPT
jgi:hypothetical protein